MREKNTNRKKNWAEYMEKRKRQRFFASAALFLLIPALILLFFKLFMGEHYGILSVLILVMVLLVFILRFEKRGLRAREIVLLATMTSLSAAANEVCAHTVPLHAGTSLVVLSGVALGPESGFLIGVLSRFICNFFDGQGPWTPWQMFAWGLLGCASGFLFNRGEKKEASFRLWMGPVVCVLLFLFAGYVMYLFRHVPGENFFGWRVYAYGTAGLITGLILWRKHLLADGITLAVFTFIFVILVYGGVMNFAALFLNASSAGEEISIEALKALYVTGLPYDISHAAGAALCVFFFGDGMLQKLERICTRYGIMF